MRAHLLSAIASSAFVASIAPPAMAQDGEDHGAMEHASMDHAAMNHGAMDHGATTPDTTDPAPTEGGEPGSMGSAGDHEMMDHGAMDHGEMDHATMDHGAMDHGAMDHGAMDHSGHGVSSSAVADQPGTAPAPPVPGDHAADAIFGATTMAASRAAMRREMRSTALFVGLDLLEYRAAKGGNGYRFDGAAWYGGDIDRAVLAYAGEGAFGERAEEIEIDAYWRHAINPWFNLQLGARHDFRPDPERTYALLGIQGLAPYWIEVEAQAFVSEKGDVHLRASAMHDMRLTQRLVFEPELEVDAALQSVPELGIGKGIEKIELAGRLRYEIAGNFAPYVGLSWERKLGQSATFARDEGEDASRVALLVGLRFWF